MSAETEIRAALLKLDTKNDDHWTEDGLPRVDALGLPKGITRGAVTAAAPLFTRANPSVEEKPKASETPPADPIKEVMTQPLVAGTNPVITAPVGPLAPTPEQIEAINAQIAELSDVVGGHQAALAAKQSELAAAQRQLDKLLELREKHTNRSNENMLGIRAVLERGKAERAAKAELAKELRSVGITAKLLQGKAPIDQVMARKTGHGLNRPNFTGRT